MASPTLTNSQVISALYIAAFGRAPDAYGLNYWNSQVINDNGNGALGVQTIVSDIAGGFANNPVFISQYSALSPFDYVNALYTNLLGSTGDAKGVQYWVNALTAKGAGGEGLSQAIVLDQFVAAVLEFDQTSARSLALPPAQLAQAILNHDTLINKANVGIYFAGLLPVASKPTQIANTVHSITTDPAYVASQLILSGITSDIATVNAAELVIYNASLLHTAHAQLQFVTTNAPSLVTVFALTAGADIQSANIFNSVLTPSSINATGPTLNANDILTGVGANPTLNIVGGQGEGYFNSSPVNIPLGLQLNNIQTINLQNNGTQGFMLDTTPYSSVLSLNVTSAGFGGSDVINALNTTAVSESQNNLNGGVNINGGSNVTVVSNGANGVIVGGGSATGLSQLNPTGVVNVTQNNGLGGGVIVNGGSSVTIAVNSSGNYGGVSVGQAMANNAVSTADSPTGNVIITDLGTGAIDVAGGNDVTVASSGGNVSVGRGQVPLLDGYVSFNNTGNVSITESVNAGLSSGQTTNANITVLGGADVTITDNNAYVVNGATTSGAGNITVGNVGNVEGLAINNPTGAVVINDLATGYVSVTGGSSVTITDTSAGEGNITVNTAKTSAVTVTTDNTGAVTVDGGSDVIVDLSGTGLGSIDTTNADKTVTINQSQDGDINVSTTDVASAVNITDTGVNSDNERADITVHAGANTATTITNSNNGDIYVGGGTSVDVSQSGYDDVTIESATGAITVKDTNVNGKYINVSGGTTVDVTTAGTGGITIDSATDAVTVTDTNVNGGYIDVTGGTTVDVTTAGTGNIGIDSATLAITVIDTHADNNSVIDITGGTTVTVTNAGAGNTTVVGATDAIKITANGTGSGNISVKGGTTVDVTTTNENESGNVTIGNVSGVTGASANSTGLVTLTRTSVTGSSNTDTIYGGGNAGVMATVKGDTVVVGDASADIPTNNTTGDVTVSNQQVTTFTNLSDANVAGGDVSVYGGKNVNVTTNTGGQVQIGADNLAGALATGTITLLDTASDRHGAYGIGQYNDPLGGPNIMGGTTVDATLAGLSVYIGVDGATDSPYINTIDNPTGAVTVTETVASNERIYVDGGNGITVNALGQSVALGIFTGVSGDVVVNQGSYSEGSVTTAYTGNALGSSNQLSSVKVDGGANVTIVTTGGNVVVGSSVSAFDSVNNPDNSGDHKGYVASGAVNIINTFSGAGTANASNVNVLGGLAVNITETNTTNGNIFVGNDAPQIDLGVLTNASSFAHGNVTILNSTTQMTNAAGTTSEVVYGAANVIVNTLGADTVSVTGADNAVITDMNAYILGEGTVGAAVLNTVNLDGVTSATIDTNAAILNLNIADAKDSNGSVTVVNNESGYSAIPAHTLNLNVNNYAGDFFSGEPVDITDNTATEVVVTTGAIASAININAAAMTSLIINNSVELMLGVDAENVEENEDFVAAIADLAISYTGSANLVLGLGDYESIGDFVFNKVTTITDTGSGDFTIIGNDTSADTILTSVDASDSTGGTVTVAINANKTSFVGGAGNDVVTLNQEGLAQTVTAGTGSDNILVANYLAGDTTTLNPANLGGSAKLSGFQTLALGSEAGTANVESNEQLYKDTITIGAVAIGNVYTIKYGGINSVNTVSYTASNLDTAATVGEKLRDLVYNTINTALGRNASPYYAVSSSLDGVFTVTGIFDGSGLIPTNFTLTSAGNLTVATTQDGITGKHIAGAYDATNFAHLTVGQTASNVSFVNVGAGVDLSVTATNNNWINYSLANASGSNDTLALAVGGVENVSAIVTTTGIETLALSNNGMKHSSITVMDTAATTIKVSGSEGLSLVLNNDNVNAANTTVTTVDASASTAGTLDLTAVTLSTAGDTVIGGGGLLMVGLNGNGTANDVITAGSGGVEVSLGQGGSWNNAGVNGAQNGITYVGASATGSETVNLSASTNAVDTIWVDQGVNAIQLGLTPKGGVTGFQEIASSQADVLNIGGTAIVNINTTSLNEVGNMYLEAGFDPSGAHASDMSQLFFSSANGVITFTSTTGHESLLSNKTLLLEAAQLIVNQAAYYAEENTTAIVNIGDNAYVVAAGGSIWQTITDPTLTVQDLGQGAGALGMGWNSVRGGVVTVNGVSVQWFVNTGDNSWTPNQHDVAVRIANAVNAALVNGISHLGNNDSATVVASVIDNTVTFANAQTVSFSNAGTIYAPTGSVATTTNEVITTHNTDKIVELIGNHANGFGDIGAANTIVSDVAAQNLSVGSLQVSGVLGNTIDASGYSLLTIGNNDVINSNGNWSTTATINNLAANATVVLEASSGQYNNSVGLLGNVDINQVAAGLGQNSLTLDFNSNLDWATQIYNEVHVSGDWAVNIKSSNQLSPIVGMGLLVDETNTLTHLTLQSNSNDSGYGAIVIGDVVSTALTSITQASSDTHLVALGVFNQSGLSQTGLNISLGDGQDLVFTSGDNDTISLGNASGNAGYGWFNNNNGHYDIVVASGNNNTITTTGKAHVTANGIEGIGANNDIIKIESGTIDANGFNDNLTVTNGANITANGDGDTITFGSGDAERNTVTANGNNDTIIATNNNTDYTSHIHASGTGDTFILTAGITLDGGIVDSVVKGIASGSIVTVGTGYEQIVITGDVAGTDIAPNLILNGVTADSGLNIVLNNAVTETMLGQVNVSTAGSLADALNLAAATAAASDLNGTNLILGHTGLVDWFQYGGNTYIEEVINATDSAALHSSLAVTDVVIKVVGLVDLSNYTINEHEHTIQY